MWDLIVCFAHKGLKHIIGIAVLCLVASSASAQTTYKDARQHRKELKRFQKEARKAEADYKETHLSISTYDLRRGEPARKRATVKDRKRNKSNSNDKAEKRKIRLFKKNKERKE